MTQQLEHKGYYGSVEVDLDEGFLYGKLLFIRDVVTYQSADAKGLRKAFEEAVDDYLATCAEMGEAPDTPCKGSFNVRVGPELHLECVLVATRTRTTLNDWVKQACQTAVAEHRRLVHVERHGRIVARAEVEFEQEPTYGGASNWQLTQSAKH